VADWVGLGSLQVGGHIEFPSVPIFDALGTWECLRWVLPAGEWHSAPLLCQTLLLSNPSWLRPSQLMGTQDYLSPRERTSRTSWGCVVMELP
jgi:hypothetical protein